MDDALAGEQARRLRILGPVIARLRSRYSTKAAGMPRVAAVRKCSPS